MKKPCESGVSEAREHRRISQNGEIQCVTGSNNKQVYTSSILQSYLLRRWDWGGCQEGHDWRCREEANPGLLGSNLRGERIHFRNGPSGAHRMKTGAGLPITAQVLSKRLRSITQTWLCTWLCMAVLGFLECWDQQDKCGRRGWWVSASPGIYSRPFSHSHSYPELRQIWNVKLLMLGFA